MGRVSEAIVGRVREMGASEWGKREWGENKWGERVGCD